MSWIPFSSAASQEAAPTITSRRFRGGGESVFAKSKKLIGQMLVEAGLLSQVDLDHCLREQAHSKQKLGSILIGKQLVNEDQFLSVLSRQLKIKRLNFKNFQPNPALKDILPETEAAKLHVVPLFKKGSLLMVAMRDPTDIAGIDSVERITRLEVEPVICNAEELDFITIAVYGRKFVEEEDILPDFDDVDVESEQEDTSAKDDLNITSLQSMAEDAPVIKIVNSILLQALNKRASDVHINPKEDRIDLRYRIDGELKEFTSPPKKFFLPLVSRIKLISNLDISVNRIPQDGRFTYRVRDKEISVRTSTLPTIYGEKIVLRLHVQTSHGLSLDQLGMGEKERDLLEKALIKPHGMILATGPTGSGKSTLLYSLIERICSPNINIVTLEDPVETRLPEVTQVQLNAKAGMTFASGLRSILRQDPDVIMVGEIRDVETAKIGIQAAMTGHKVFSTLHTNDASGAVSRFIEMGIEPFLISSTLLVVVAQRLVRKLCPHCVEPYEPDATQLHTVIKSPPPGQKIHFFRSKGCVNCEHIGYRGRVGVYEVLQVDNTIKDLILKRASAFAIKQKAVQTGKLRTLKMDAAFKVLQGVTSLQEYLTVAI
jgi:type IV pilus assembly protein PilB